MTGYPLTPSQRLYVLLIEAATTTPPPPLDYLTALEDVRGWLEQLDPDAQAGCDPVIPGAKYGAYPSALGCSNHPSAQPALRVEQRAERAAGKNAEVEAPATLAE
jgi:hypothetical protein